MNWNDSSPAEILPQGNEGLSGQIESLLGELFAEENHLRDLSLESIEYLLEETKQIKERAESEEYSLTGTPELEQSFERCLALFCNILMELENQDFENVGSETLLEIKQSQNQTRFINTKPAAPKLVVTPEPLVSPAAPLSSDDFAESPEEKLLVEPSSFHDTAPQAEPPTAANLYETPDEFDPSIHFDMHLRRQEEKTRIKKAAAERANAEEATPAGFLESSITPLFTQSEIVAPPEDPNGIKWDPDLIAVPPEESSIRPSARSTVKTDTFTSAHGSSQLSIPEMMEKADSESTSLYADFASAVPPELPSEPQEDPEATQVPKPKRNFSHLPTFSEIKEVNRHINAPEAMEPEFPSPPDPELGAESPLPSRSPYRQLSRILEVEVQAKHPELADKSLYKIMTLALCGELEERCQAILEPLLSKIWSVREALITPLMRQDDRRFEFHPQLRAAMEDLGVTHAQWLYEEKLPYSGILGALKYLVSTQDRMKYRPTAIDYGMILMLFGQDETMGGFLLQNHLEFPCPASDVTEIALRLFRVHKFRQIALNVRKDFTLAELDTARQDIWNILRVLESHSGLENTP